MSTAPIRHPATTMQANALRPSARLPVIFLGHGSPMNAIEDNPFRRSWQALGAELAQRYEKPQLILCVSAHWLTSGWWLTAMSQPRTIHDFGGFPRALFDQRNAAPGAPDVAQHISELTRPAMLHAAIDRQNNVSLIPVQLPGESGVRHSAHESLAQAVEHANLKWIRITYNKHTSGYDVYEAEGALPEPEWPTFDIDKLVEVAFRGKIITSLDHPVIQTVLGKI